MLDINIATPSSVMEGIRYRYKSLRLECDLTQEGLANKSEVSLGSIKRFESSGQISLESLLKLSLSLGCLEQFENIAVHQKEKINSIDELVNQKVKKVKKRGSIK